MATLLFDTFHDVNGTALASHVPIVGGPWVDDSAGWQIQSNALLQSAGACLSHVEVGQKIEGVYATFNLGGVVGGSGLILTLQDDTGNNEAQFVVAPSGAPSLQILVAGTKQVTEQAKGSALISLSADHTFQMVLGPDLCQVFIDGVLWFTFPRTLDKTFAPTRVAIQTTALAGTGIVFKNLTLAAG